MVKGWVRLSLALGVVAVAASSGVIAMAHARVSDSLAIESLRTSLEGILGIEISVKGSVSVAFLPRPRLTIHDVKLSARGGRVLIDVPVVQADPALLPLIRGRVVFDRVELVEPTGTVAADVLTSMEQAPSGSSDSSQEAMPAKVVVTSGLVRFEGQGPASGLVTDLHASVDGLDGSAASITGHAGWHGEAADFSARIQDLSAFLNGRRTGVSAKLRSSLLTGSLKGSLANGFGGGLSGAVSLSSPAFSMLLATLDLPILPNQLVQHASFSGTAETTDAGTAFSEAKLVLNDTLLEGALGWQGEPGHKGLVGTFAADDLAFGSLLTVLPALRDMGGGWSERGLELNWLTTSDIDIRISAGHATFGAFEAEDAAVSVLCHKNRLETTLGEARAYGGLVKGRLVADGGNPEIGLKLDVSWSQIDLAQAPGLLSVGQDQIAGQTSGHVTLASRGSSVRSLVAASTGRGQLNIRQGRVAGLPTIATMLRPDDGSATLPLTSSFDLAGFDVSVAAGEMTVGPATITGPDVHVALNAHASLLDGTYAITSAPLTAADTAAGGLAPTVAVAGALGRTGPQLSRVEALGATPAEKQDGLFP